MMNQDQEFSDHQFLSVIRQALLLMVDAIERKLGIERTSALRRKAKEDRV
jgi:hypothetical protein